MTLTKITFPAKIVVDEKLCPWWARPARAGGRHRTGTTERGSPRVLPLNYAR